MVIKGYFTKQLWVIKKRKAEEKVVKSFIPNKFRRGNNRFIVSQIKNFLKYLFQIPIFSRLTILGRPAASWDGFFQLKY
jgi:hypothetical protein